MQISTRGRYAVMAMVDLAVKEAAGECCGPICLAEVAARQQLSQSYLEQLFGKLRRADLVSSARGPGGGYRLARAPEAIAIADIIYAVDEPINATRCEPDSGGCMAAPGAGGSKCQTHDLWFELGRQITLFLSNISLADVVAGRVTGRAVSPPPTIRRAGGLAETGLAGCSDRAGPVAPRPVGACPSPGGADGCANGGAVPWPVPQKAKTGAG